MPKDLIYKISLEINHDEGGITNTEEFIIFEYSKTSTKEYHTWKTFVQEVNNGLNIKFKSKPIFKIIILFSKKVVIFARKLSI